MDLLLIVCIMVFGDSLQFFTMGMISLPYPYPFHFLLFIPSFPNGEKWNYIKFYFPTFIKQRYLTNIKLEKQNSITFYSFVLKS